jgi:hypothetical protein
MLAHSTLLGWKVVVGKQVVGLHCLRSILPPLWVGYKLYEP